MTNSVFNGKRISPSDLTRYMMDSYNCSNPFVVDQKNIIGFPSLLQRDYGAPQDCTLVSITSIVNYFTKLKLDPEDIYDYVEQVAKGYFYNGNSYGTIPVFINSIFNKVNAKFGLSKKSKSGYGKGVGYNIAKIKEQINKNNPMILNISSDGRGYYKNHSVVIIGYLTYQIDSGKQVHLITVYDNWSKNYSYVDYNKLCAASSINYLI